MYIETRALRQWKPYKTGATEEWRIYFNKNTFMTKCLCI